ncbi:TonB-dependent siderophore receptor [Methylobacillus arboreus]|uniref:TonB-dependent siderophore receptor n=1 Tax=Methylobacillus arboreus TaxID=755170 RepID=UPI001E4FC78D|nr:TonB-dependent siderophore receptor [Methylobacillus arboreus]MCB5190030.1 TonB-dependent siderophore receptor [Methylobacillus arboreus]
MKQLSISELYSPKLVYAVVSALFAMPVMAADESGSVLPEVAVVGAKTDDETSSYVAKKTKSATKTDTSILETPQSISVIDRKELDDRNAQNLNDALGYTAGVRTEGLGMDSRAESYSIRGFKGGLDTDDGTSNLFLDGLRVQGGGQWNRASFDTYGLERVEVLKGPSAAIYGQIVPGGLINLVTKRPTLNQVNEVRLQGGSFDQYKAAFDIGGSLADDNSVLFRLVGSFNDGNSQVDHTDLQRTYFAPSLLWQISENTSLTLLAQYQRDKGGSTFQFLPYFGTVKASPAGGRLDIDTFLGEPGWNLFDREQSLVGWSFEHRFNDIWQFRQNARYTNIENDIRGVVGGIDNGSAPSGIFSRRAVLGHGQSEGVAIDNQLQADFSTGEIKHTVLLGLDAQRINWQNNRYGATASSISLFNPVYTGIGNPTFNLQSDYDADQKQTGAYLQEQLAWNNWRFSLGGRYDRFDNSLLNKANNRHNDFEDHAFTWRTGAVYLFDNGFAPFVSYSTSFDPGPLTTVTWQDVSLKPIKGKQYEAGVKYQPPGSNSLVSVSVYELTQENRVVTDSTPGHVCVNPNGAATCSTQVGEAKIKGLEVEGKAALTEQLSLLGSYTYMDSEITKSNNALEQGNQLINIPRHMSSLWANYAFTTGNLDGLSVGLGVRYVGGSYGLTAPTATAAVGNEKLYVDSYTLFDAAVRYDLKSVGWSGAEVAVNATNLTDREYVATCSGIGACFYGMGRVVNATLKYNW